MYHRSTFVSILSIQVILGEHHLYEIGEGSLTERIIEVKDFTNHPDFNYKETGSFAHDISVLELAEEIDHGIYTPACLAKSSDATTFDGKMALVYGTLRSI